MISTARARPTRRARCWMPPAPGEANCAEIAKHQADRSFARQPCCLCSILLDLDHVDMRDEIVRINDLEHEHLGGVISLTLLNQGNKITDQCGPQQVHRRGCDLRKQNAAFLTHIQRLENHGSLTLKKPRPGVDFPTAVALKDSDQQAIGNGITTVFHGVTASWELGLRSMEMAHSVLQELERTRPELAADSRLHLRYETYNLDAEVGLAEWLATRRIDMLGFNDHLPGKDGPPRLRKIEQMAERAGLSPQDFLTLVERLKTRGEEVPEAIARLAMLAREHRVP